MSPYQKGVDEITALAMRLAALSLDDKPIYPEMPSPAKTPVTMFFKRMTQSRRPTLKPEGYQSIRSNLGLHEMRGTYSMGLEGYQTVHLERYLFIYGRPQYVFEDSPLIKLMESEKAIYRQTSKWYTVFREIAAGRQRPTMPYLDHPTNEMFRDWTYRVDQDPTDNTLKLLDRYATWDATDDAIIGDAEFTPNVLVTRRIAMDDLQQVESRLPHAFAKLVPHIQLAIKTFLEIEFGIVDYDFDEGGV